MIAPIVIDENKAPFVPESETRASYHCPRTNCDGHFYLRPAELGHEFVCDKCGLPITIGRGKGTLKNYRHGLQRLYVVLAISWITFVVVATQSGRWRPWPYMPRASWELPPHDSVVPAPHGQWEIESETPIVPPVTAPSPTKTNGPQFVSPEKFLRDAALQEERHRSIVRWSWVTGIAIVPSALGYVLLFYVAPWVYRGFRPGTQI